MVTLTSADIMALLKKNELEPNRLEYEVVERLREKNLKVATAESCTGGLISERITRVSGASEVFDCGVCSYANEIKEKLLGVRSDTLSILGAVSAETAIQTSPSASRESRDPRAAPRRSPSDLCSSEYAAKPTPTPSSCCSAGKTTAASSAPWRARRLCSWCLRKRTNTLSLNDGAVGPCQKAPIRRKS